MTDTPETDIPDVNFRIDKGWGVIDLDRPRALNSLTTEMCAAVDHVLRQWADNDEVAAIIVRTDNEKAFCAGGDIRALYDRSKEDPRGAAEFFRVEYTMNALIHGYDKPYIALVDGICMGGGVGISIGASHLVMSEKALWAMPETGIGLFPDVGGSHFLPRLDGGFGAYLALTGHRLSGADCRYAGIADHLVEENSMADLEKALMAIGAEDLDDDAICDVISQYEVNKPSQLTDSKPDIDQYFTAPGTLEDLIAALKGGGGGFATHTLERLERMSPTSMKIALEQLRRGRHMSFKEVMRMEFGIASRVMEGPDFQEGVRALIVDKDKNPQWSPATPEAVSDDYVARYFEPLEDKPLDI
ncbi:enoyl-CoA hydratase/isomerase family protein [Aquisalinus flavus]|uniref:3-hydroxyisobutyryl-CoA hydrolase n=1 Tax=Aquisalinus flavus TaxID=1526572 RepID=A0A8J2V475_9PROT|nr:enoyl-CoA hydratase/isomerase family protein [Aquisalinus flavus]MBD0427360.1 enoyl-CoA hydratase/isomerase family protein [Aquisalinus flavus]UNE47165.1 enoyl-CoA hydratase/isomerase family protein [Aquisalinus flavus]GGD00402.1 enoyl-CoA hydratase [Aquisalinus flavus]